jgi:hypothetical protein
VCNVAILTEYATEVASVEEHTPIPTTSLEARLFAKVRRDSVHDHIDINQARASLFELVDATQPRAEVTVAQMRVCCRAFLRFLDRREQLIPGCAFVEEEWRGWVGSETGVLQVYECSVRPVCTRHLEATLGSIMRLRPGYRGHLLGSKHGHNTVEYVKCSMGFRGVSYLKGESCFS